MLPKPVCPTVMFLLAHRLKYLIEKKCKQLRMRRMSGISAKVKTTPCGKRYSRKSTYNVISLDDAKEKIRRFLNDHIQDFINRACY